jgi:hypothetical protein
MTHVESECLSQNTWKQFKYILLKKDNEGSVMIERKGYLTIGDET